MVKSWYAMEIEQDFEADNQNSDSPLSLYISEKENIIKRKYV